MSKSAAARRVHLKVETLEDRQLLAAGPFNYGEALQKALFFYDAQRAGDLPANFRVEWRGDAALTDGADVGLNLSGGFWDAGDHVKFALPMASSMTVLTWGLLQYRDAYVATGQVDELESVLRWGANWLMAAHPSPNVFYAQVGNGELDHSFWGAPEVMQMARPTYKLDITKPGSDAAGEAAAFLAAASIHFRTSDVAYANQLLQHARELYAFADQYRGIYSDSIPDAGLYYRSSGYQDELTWGALWLYKATGEVGYLQKAQSVYAQNFAGQSFTWTHAWDDKRYGSSILLAQLTGQESYKGDVERWLNYWTVGNNGNRIAYTPGGLAFLSQWGSLRYASTTAFLALIYSDTVRDYAGRYHNFAVSQMNYILGQNPANRSYVVGFGTNSPQFPHHRGASGVWDGNVDNPTPNRHILYGALVGGPESTDDFNYQDVRGDYISNEVALDYNAGFTGALARLFQEYGGQPLATFPIPEVRDDEFFVEAKINQQSSRYTEISGWLNNRSAWPARASTNLGYRYFVNLTETYAAGFTSSDIVVNSFYSQGATVGPLTAWNAAQHIYYVDVKFQGVDFRPGPGTFKKEAQLRIGIRDGLPTAAWDPTNDWSYQGLVSSGAHQKTVNIPVYENGVKLFGQIPSSGGGGGGPPTMNISDVTITEGDSGTKQMTFNVTLTGPSSQTVTARYYTVDGTASGVMDYIAAKGVVSFAPGVVSQTINIAVRGDTVQEGTETFQVVLGKVNNAVAGRVTATGTILDNDAPVSPVNIAFALRDDWGTGFVADISITNNGTTDIDGWTLQFDFPVEITNLWNGELVSRVGNRYTVRNAAWNRVIRPGQTVTFGFQGLPGNLGNLVPTNYVFNGVPIT